MTTITSPAAEAVRLRLGGTKARYRATRHWGECFDDWFDRVSAEARDARRPSRSLWARVTRRKA